MVSAFYYVLAFRLQLGFVHLPMAKNTRIFEKSVTLVTQGQYEPRGKTLRLLRWRLIAEGVEGAWRKASVKEGTGGWPKVIKMSELPPESKN